MFNIDIKTLEEIKDKISNEFSKIIAYEKTVQVVDGCERGWFWGVWLGFSDFPKCVKIILKAN